MEIVDRVVPGDKWEFDNQVTEAFDNMLQRSIPGYSDMRRLTSILAIEFAKPGTHIVDLGCSRGGSLQEIVDKLGDKNKYLGIEISTPMRMAAIERFKDYKGLELSIKDIDLRYDYPEEESSVVLSVLTLQFIPIEYRQKVLAKAYASLGDGGIFILVEKILGRDSHTNDLFVKLYYDLKGANGYSEEQINSKRRSLEGVLVPVTSDWNEQLMKGAGFQHIECFWRNLNFAGWIGVKNV
jgi:tRNA (cmo5U34)-methyltransferase